MVRMPPSPVERSLSMSDVEALTRHCRRRTIPLPFDFSAAVGYGDKKDIFKMVRPKRKFKGLRSTGHYSAQSLRTTKSRERFSSMKVNQNPLGSTVTHHSLVESNPRSEYKDERIIPSTSKSIKSPTSRPRSKTLPCPQPSTSEGKTCTLRSTKSLTHLPHLKLCLGPRDSRYNRMEPDVVVRFPEKSVLLLAQEEDDQVQMELSSLSSVVAPYSQENGSRRKDDSGVQISDRTVLSWRSDQMNAASEPSIPSSGTLFPYNQAQMRRVSTKSSLQSNYVPSLEKLMEEPLPSHKTCKQQINNSVLDSAGTNERKDLGEVVVSHWTRVEQQGSDPRLTTNQSRSFENKARSSSLSLVNEVTEEVLFSRSSTNISETEFEKQGKEKTKQRRVTIATENPVSELSPHYATKLEKEAFKKIKQWKEGFAVRLDQVLKQRQIHTQGNDNTEKTHRDKFANVSFQPGHPFKEYTIHSFSNTSKPQDVQIQLLTELRGVSEISLRGLGGTSGCDTGSRILKEIKKQRRSSKGLGENKKIMDDLSSWHRKETGRITSDLSSYTSDVQHVRGLLCSLKETIDTIFSTTLQRVGDLVNSSTMKNNSHMEHAPGTHEEDVLLRSQIKRVEDERDRLFMENDSLKKQIADLRSMLHEVQKGHEPDFQEMEERMAINNESTSGRESCNLLRNRQTIAETIASYRTRHS
ncbi:uncharacterized protein LOC144632872 isoform X1 [Oculina patagonica]